ncbi:DUF4199 domain-containing protein [Phaeocystidibacter luteus]|uniref:DUF4199 domain-containing protein n=1 Tax=Phaeocystidibacter luteus TaxID=911197 RepID=A0A6N6RMA7_9FLAO|nr:DUF4199 domain-containing protein [Phaeocystidibacter luteus]KAB2814731.1 DUF4199 domain-containing protein [Phaeocystidibacter luteus]
MNEHVKKHSVQWGLIVAAIGISYYVVAYSVDWSLYTNWVAGLLILFLNIGLLIVPVVKVKKAQGGFLSFKEGFSAYVVAWIVQSLVSVTFSILLFNVIDPQAGVEINEMIIDAQIEMMEGFGMPDQQLAEAVEQLEGQNSFSVETQVTGMIKGIVLGAVIGLIVGAIFSKKRPFLDNEQQEETLDA